MKTWWRLSLFLLLHAALAHAAPAPEPHALDAEVIWSSGERTAALFVPASVLERGLAEAPLSSNARTLLAGRVEREKGRAECVAWESSHDLSAAAAPRPVTQIFAESQALFTARVVAVVSGWSASHLDPVTVVWVEPLTRVRDTHGVIGGDTLLAFAVAQGELRIGGARLCSGARKTQLPKRGDELVIDAVQRLGDGRLVAVSHFFPVVDGQLQPGGYRDVTPFHAVPLERALAAAKQGVRK